MAMNEFIDLRSDTVTLPTEQMLDSIKRAKLGDDVFREDSTVNKLEDLAAERMGKEAAMLVTSGTQANLVSLMSNAQRGEMVFLESQSHMYWYEVGGISSIAGLMPWPIKSNFGVFDPEDLEAAIRPRNVHFPDPSLICIENTHNRHGGTIVTPEQIGKVKEFAESHRLKLYMDGARIFNAAVALNLDVKQLTKHVDNLMFCLSKGLSCPVGSILVGTDGFIEKARKRRKILGGGMRQAGIIAAPGIIALEKMIDRLKEDHANAKILAKALSKIPGINIDLTHVHTNIILFDISKLGIDDSLFLSNLREKGILALTLAKNRVRMVTHRGIEREHMEKTIVAISEIAQKL